LAAGSRRPVEWQAGWRVGVKFILNQTTRLGPVETAFPNGTENPDSLEFHYLAFDMPATKASPAPGPMAAVALLAVAATLKRRR